MSIEYQDGTDRDTLNLVTALAQQDWPGADTETGEVIEVDAPVGTLFEEEKQHDPVHA